MIIELREANQIRAGMDIEARLGVNNLKSKILNIQNKKICKWYKLNKPNIVYSRKIMFQDSKYHPKFDASNKRI
jgi:hypothetical protein